MSGTTSEMDKEGQKKSAVPVKARLKAEYKKFMNEKPVFSTRDQKKLKDSTSSSSSSSASNDSTKRKRVSKA